MGRPSLSRRWRSLGHWRLLSGRAPSVPGRGALAPGAPPSGARGRGRPRAALFQDGAGGGGSLLPAPVVPALRILVPE